MQKYMSDIFQNVRKLKLGGEKRGAVETLKAVGIDVIGITEVNNNWYHPIVRKDYGRMTTSIRGRIW